MIQNEIIGQWINAAFKDDLNTIKSLYTKYGDDILNVHDIYGNCALTLSSTRDNENKVFYFIIEKPNLDVNVVVNQHTPLMLAYNKYDEFKLLLNHPNIQINKVTTYGTALKFIYTRVIGKITMHSLKLLLSQYDLDVNLCHPILHTTSHIENVIALICDRRIDLNVKDGINQDFIDKLRYHFDTSFLFEYDLQKTIIDNNHNNIKPFINHNIVHSDIQKEYADIISAIELNIL